MFHCHVTFSNVESLLCIAHTRARVYIQTGAKGNFALQTAKVLAVIKSARGIDAIAKGTGGAVQKAASSQAHAATLKTAGAADCAAICPTMDICA